MLYVLWFYLFVDWKRKKSQHVTKQARRVTMKLFKFMIKRFILIYHIMLKYLVHSTWCHKRPCELFADGWNFCVKHRESEWYKPKQNNKPFAVYDHMVQKTPCWRANCPLRQPKQKDITLNCFVLYVSVCSLLSAKVFFVPCDRKLQRANWEAAIFASCNFGRNFVSVSLKMMLADRRLKARIIVFYSFIYGSFSQVIIFWPDSQLLSS